MEDHIQEDFEDKLWSTQMKSLQVAKETFKLSISTEGCGYMVTSAIMVVGAYSIFNLNLSLGDLVAFIGYQATLNTIVSTLANIYGDISSTRAGLDQLFTVLDTPSDTFEKPDAKMPEKIIGNIEFRNITFGYEPKKPVLQNINLSVPAGQTIALVGPSGGGKTTIANLLLRFYDLDSGQLLLDGTDIRHLLLFCRILIYSTRVFALICNMQIRQQRMKILFVHLSRLKLGILFSIFPMVLTILLARAAVPFPAVSGSELP
jgi:subfamily B ATP-binding cassette protein MsbA